MRHLLPALATLIALAPAQMLMAADNAYPARPLRLIVPYPPGGGSDITGRAIGNKLTEYLSQTFVIDNRPGTTGLIGIIIAARSPADGYTIILADAPHTINSLVYAKPPYDAIRDFTPLNLVATSPQALPAHPQFSANTLKELLAIPRVQTEKRAMGSSGLASGPHLVYECLKLRTGLTLNPGPFKDGGPSLADAGQIPLVMNAVPGRHARRQSQPPQSPRHHQPATPSTAAGHADLHQAGVKDFVTFRGTACSDRPARPRASLPH